MLRLRASLRFFSQVQTKAESTVAAQSNDTKDLAPFKKIDTRPKHLQHMTPEDFIKPDPELMKYELQELIKEARTKIKPVFQILSEAELKSLIKSVEEVKGDKQVIINRPKFYEVLEKNGITLEELRKIQDKHYEVDIEYELTKDLFEKQRIIDQYLVQHQEDNKMLNQYFQNGYADSKQNKFQSLVYLLPYHAIDLRFNYRMMWFTSGIAAGALAMIHPVLSGLLLYDFYLLFRATQVMNQTANTIVLDTTKRHVLLNKLNFLGYETAPGKQKISLRDIKYMGEFENKFVTMNNYGILPSFSKFFKESLASIEDDQSQGHFRFFHKFVANSEVYLVSKDHPQQAEYIASEELLIMIMKGEQSKVLKHDFTHAEAVKHSLLKDQAIEMKRVLQFKQMAFEFKDDTLQRKYCDFVPNREYSGHLEQQKFKKVDDGTFIDNGYR